MPIIHLPKSNCVRFFLSDVCLSKRNKRPVPNNVPEHPSIPSSLATRVQSTGASNDGIFPNASEVSEMYHSVLGKPV